MYNIHISIYIGARTYYEMLDGPAPWRRTRGCRSGNTSAGLTLRASRPEAMGSPGRPVATIGCVSLGICKAEERCVPVNIYIICVYIYIYICNVYTSLSLSIYIYIYIYMHMYNLHLGLINAPLFVCFPPNDLFHY